MKKFRDCKILISVTLSLMVVTGCLQVTGSESLGPSLQNKESFANKKIAILPVKTQAQLSTDTILPLRNKINKELYVIFKQKLPSSSYVLDTGNCVNLLNRKGKLAVLDELYLTYEHTGVFDKRQIDKLSSILKANYLVFPNLKAEKMDIIISKAQGTSLQVLMVNSKTSEIVWGGIGEHKKGGIFGLGGADSDVVANELTRLALQDF
jgi:hypothetical protein